MAVQHLGEFFNFIRIDPATDISKNSEYSISQPIIGIPQT